MTEPRKDISEWDKRFSARWREAFVREFGIGKVAAQQLADLDIHPTTIKSWTSKGGRPTVANLCLVARKARDPSAFIAEVCADELWARELAVAVQRRRLGDAEAALAACRAEGDGNDPVGVIRQFAGPPRAVWLIDDQGHMRLVTKGPEAEAQRIQGAWNGEGSALDTLLRDRGWVMVEQDEDQPPVIQCHAVSGSARAFDVLMAWLEQTHPTQGFILRVFIIDWVDIPCASLYQLQGELDRLQHMKALVAADRWRTGGPLVGTEEGNATDAVSGESPAAPSPARVDGDSPDVPVSPEDPAPSSGVAADDASLDIHERLDDFLPTIIGDAEFRRQLSPWPRWRLAAVARDQNANQPAPTSERIVLDEAPHEGHDFWNLWRECGGVVGNDMIQNLKHSRLFDLVGIYGVLDHQFRVGFVGPQLRLPVGMTREKVTGHDILEIQAPRGYGLLIASHFALAAHERVPVVHRIRVTHRRSYRRVSFPIFDHRGRRVVAIIGFSDARITEDTS